MFKLKSDLAAKQVDSTCAGDHAVSVALKTSRSGQEIALLGPNLMLSLQPDAVSENTKIAVVTAGCASVGLR